MNIKCRWIEGKHFRVSKRKSVKQEKLLFVVQTFSVLSFIFISLSCPPLPPRFSWTDAPPHFSLPLSKHGPWEGTRNLQKSFLKSSGSIIATDFKNLRERRSREERLCLLTNSYDLFLLWSTFFFFFSKDATIFTMEGFCSFLLGIKH